MASLFHLFIRMAYSWWIREERQLDYSTTRGQDIVIILRFLPDPLTNHLITAHVGEFKVGR